MLLKNAAIILQKEMCVKLYKYQQHQYKKPTTQTKSVIQISSCQRLETVLKENNSEITRKVT